MTHGSARNTSQQFRMDMMFLCLSMVSYHMAVSFVQMDTLFGYFLGLACRPTDLTIALLGRSSCPRDSNPGWGDWRRSFGGWAVFCFVGFVR